MGRHHREKICQQQCYQPLVIQGLPGFPGLPGSGGDGDGSPLQNRILQVAQGYSPGDLVENYQFLTIQSAIDYAASQNPTLINQFVIYIAPGFYNEILTVSNNISLAGSGYNTVIITGVITYNMNIAGIAVIENILNPNSLIVNILIDGSTFYLRNSSISNVSVINTSISGFFETINSQIQILTLTGPFLNSKIGYCDISNGLTAVDNNNLKIIGSMITPNFDISGTTQPTCTDCNFGIINLLSASSTLVAKQCNMSTLTTVAGSSANILGSTFQSITGLGSVDRTQSLSVTGTAPSVPVVLSPPYIDANYQVAVTQTAGVLGAFLIQNKLAAGFNITSAGVAAQDFDVIVTRTFSTLN